MSDTAGTVWAYIQNWSARGITLVVFFVLVRILSPAEFGTFAVTMVFLTLGEIFVEQLFGHAIVQRQTLTDAHLNSAFAATLAIGCGLAFGTFFAAPYFASAFDSPDAAPLIKALTPVFLFMALASVPAALLHRALDYRTLARRTALSNLLSGIVAIAAALGGLGVWTFVLQQLVYQAVSTVVLWRSEAWRPHCAMDRTALYELFHFSGRVTLGKVLDLIETRLVELVVAKSLGIEALGNFALAVRAQMAATQLIAAPLWLSSISIFAHKQSDREVLLAAVHDRSQLAALLVMPVFLFAAATGDVLVPTVFGEHWLSAVAPFQILCLLGALRSFTWLYLSLLQAVGAAGAVAANTFARTVATIGALPFLLPYGPAGVATSLLIGQLAALPFIFYSVLASSGLKPMQIVSTAVKPSICAISAAVLGFITVKFRPVGLPNLVAVSAGIAVSSFVFTLLILFAMPGRLAQMAASLPARFVDPVVRFLDVVKRFEDSVRAGCYMAVLTAHGSVRADTPPVEDAILVFPDCCAVGGSVDDHALFGGLIDLLRQSGATTARVVCHPGVQLPNVGGITLNPLPIWGRLGFARQMARELAGASALVVVGADVLDGFYSRYESLLRLGLAKFAADHGVPALLCSFSFNAHADPATVAAFRKLPPGVQLLCRDSVSRDRLQKIVDNRVQLTADVAYLLSPSAESQLGTGVANWLSSCDRRSGPVIGWNLSPHSLLLLSTEQRSNAAKASANVIERLVKERDASVVLIPHDFRKHAGDQALLMELLNHIPIAVRQRVMLAEGPYAAADVKEVCQEFDLVLTGRMRLMIAALGRNVPVLAVEYQGKFAGALAHFDLTDAYVLQPQEVCSSELLFKRVCVQLDELPATRIKIQIHLSRVQVLASSHLLESFRG